MSLIGSGFGRLTVQSLSDRTDSSRNRYWNCVCVCGVSVVVAGFNLKAGRTKSCGCLLTEYLKGRHLAMSPQHKEVLRAIRTTHNHYKSRTYKSWQSMKTRCLKLNHKDYHHYGGRGITICDRWLKSFENFLTDMGERPIGKTLDRYPNPNGNYEPSNCRWANLSEQNLNRRSKGDQKCSNLFLTLCRRTESHLQ